MNIRKMPSGSDNAVHGSSVRQPRSLRWKGSRGCAKILLSRFDSGVARQSKERLPFGCGETVDLHDATLDGISGLSAAVGARLVAVRFRPREWQILEARYGTAERNVDVTSRLRSMVRDGRISIRVDNRTMGSDPAKILWVTYYAGGQGQRQVKVYENADLTLP